VTRMGREGTTMAPSVLKVKTAQSWRY